MIKFIVYAWKYNLDRATMLSRKGESLCDFKSRVASIFPDSEGWFCDFSEYQEIHNAGLYQHMNEGTEAEQLLALIELRRTQLNRLEARYEEIRLEDLYKDDPDEPWWNR